MFHLCQEKHLKLLVITPLVIIAKDNIIYSNNGSESLKVCKSTFLKYHSSASLFAFLPITRGICEVSLTHQIAYNALSLCSTNVTKTFVSHTKKLMDSPFFFISLNHSTYQSYVQKVPRTSKLLFTMP